MQFILQKFSTLNFETVAGLIWILVLIIAGPLLLRLAASRIIRYYDDGDDARETGNEKKAKTLAGLVQTTGKVIIYIFSLIWLLRIFGIDAYPLIAGASVLGFGVGFGAQTLIKDFFSGIFIFSENQFAVGDRVKLGTHEGRVIKMTFRSTVLCDADGNIVFLPNGSITSVVNYSLGKKE